MGDIAAAFFHLHLAEFFRGQLTEALSPNAGSTVLERVLRVVDALLRLVGVNELDLAQVLHDVLKDFLDVTKEDVARRETLELQSLFHGLLYATPKYKEKRRFAQKTHKVLSQLRMECALQSDSSDFRKFFIETLAPRIQSDREAVENLAEAAEISEEVEAIYRRPVLKRPPSSPSSNPFKKIKEESHFSPSSTVHHSPKQDSALLHLDAQVQLRNLKRNLSRDPRKEVSIRMAPVRVQLTPEHEQSCISDSAKALKEVNKQFFYEKKKLSAMKKEDDGEFVTPKVLVTDTPKKEDTVRGRHVPAFRNIFS